MTDPSADKREAILASALELFAEYGFHATSVPQVAENARVALGTIYRYFPSKEALVNELYRLWKERLGVYLVTGHPLEAPPRVQFRHFWERAVEFALEYPKAIRFLELHHHLPYLDEKSREVEQLAIQPALAAMEQAKRLEVVKDLPAQLLLAIVWGAFLGVIKGVWEQRVSPGTNTLRDAEQCVWEAIRR
jgi:AcrR family transcriptional regulator